MTKKNITLDGLAVMVKKGFDGVDKRFDETGKQIESLRSDVKFIKRSVSNLEFIASEMVRRDEFFELKREVEILKAKIAA